MADLALNETKPTIMHVIGATIAGGAETFVANLAMALSASGHDVVLLALSSRSDSVGNALRQRLPDAGVRFFCGPTEKIGLGTLAWYRRVTKQIKPATVHLHTPNTELVHFLAMLAASKRPRVFRTLHNTRMTLGPMTRLALAKNRVEVSVACGAGVMQVAHRFVAGPVLCIPNGIAFHWPVQNDAERFQARKRLGLATEGWHFLNIGRLSASSTGQLQKAQDILIEAWGRTRFERSDVFLHLLGDGNLRPTLEAACAHDPSVFFHGVRADVHDWLLAADCFVMPSRHEGLPIAGIEALGTGLPCIFSDIPPLRELTEQHALWVPRENAPALSDALQTAVKKAMTKPDAAALRQRYGIGGVAAAYAELYENTALGLSKSTRRGKAVHNHLTPNNTGQP